MFVAPSAPRRSGPHRSASPELEVNDLDGTGPAPASVTRPGADGRTRRALTVPAPSGPAEVDARDVLDATDCAVAATDVDGLVVHWNTAAEELYGWTAQEALGRHISQTAMATLDHFSPDTVLVAARNGKGWSGPLRVRRKDGSCLLALLSSRGVYRQGVLTAVVVSGTHLGAALGPLLECSTDAALVLGSDGVVTYVSPGVREVFGWDENQLVGSSVIPLLHPDDRARLAQFLTTVVEQPGIHAPLELRVRRSRDWKWAEVAVTNLLDDALVHGIVCHLRLDRRRTAQEEAELRAAQLQTALDTRVVIEQAKGFLACQAGVPPDVAFDRIRRYARDNRATVREVSRLVVSGDLVLAG